MANLRAQPHLLIIGEPLTVARTPITYFRASCTGCIVKIGTAQHEGNARPTDVDAIEQQTEVSRLHVAASSFHTMAQCLNADIVALTTTGDAFLKVDR
jgi:hypothetical protein